jgi:hypothetical protein
MDKVGEGTEVWRMGVRRKCKREVTLGGERKSQKSN